MNRIPLSWVLVWACMLPSFALAQPSREALNEASWTSGLSLRNVGPSVMGGRVVDVAVVADTMYVAYATGGLWRSINHGTTFEPMLDETCMLGAVAAHPSGRIVVGSGEVNSSRSSYAGDGMYLSDDFGKTWRHAGLEDTHHVGRVAMDPNNPDRIWVAAMGSLYSDNGEGGVYRTEDGGQQWTKVLEAPAANTGFVDLVVDDNNADHLFAASWERTRRAHDFTESGLGSGVWESIDGGTTWNRISAVGNFPEGEGAGRIGLTYHASSQTLYALIDNQAPRPDQGQEEDEGLQAEDFLAMDADAFADVDLEALATFLEDNGFAEADSARAVKERVASGTLEPRALHDYLTDGNRAMFDVEIVGPELYRYSLRSTGSASGTLDQLASGNTQPAPRTWNRTHDGWLDDVWYSYGYYFGTLSCDPADERVVYIAGVPLLKSTDGGQTFKSIGAPNVHVDHHKVWVDPANGQHLINGNDGGINVSWDGGESWIKCNSPAVGQFYAIEVDNADPYRIYGGLQDNGTWVGSSTHRESVGWHQSGRYGYEGLGGGDGMQIEVDARNNDVVYTGYQFGWYQRTDRSTDTRTSLHPMHELGETPLRWNWQTPILLSAHQQDVLYMGSNKLHRSLNQGDDWETLSGDLTRGGLKGNVPFGTLTCIDEHPNAFGQLVVGSDDGLVHVTMDGGHSWQPVDLPVPTQWGKKDKAGHLWVSATTWSHHDEDLLVVALNGYRHDRFDALVFATRDLGKTWENWGQFLPNEPVNALVEWHAKPGWWVVGTDGGAYLTADGGQSFAAVHRDLPRVPVHDLAIQEREFELVLGTHGRSIYVLDMEPLAKKPGTPEGWNETALSIETEPDDVAWTDEAFERGWAWSEPSPVEATCWAWSNADRSVEVRLAFQPEANDEAEGATNVLTQLQESTGFTVDMGRFDLRKGVQQLALNLGEHRETLVAGTYELRITPVDGGESIQSTLVLLED